jgi:hypothetical protein
MFCIPSYQLSKLIKSQEGGKLIDRLIIELVKRKKISIQKVHDRSALKHMTK